MNAVYRGELHTIVNLFQPCVKLIEKERVRPKLRRIYDKAMTPLDRLDEACKATSAIIRLLEQRETTDPFTLSKSIEQQLKQLEVRRRQTKKRAA